MAGDEAGEGVGRTLKEPACHAESRGCRGILLRGDRKLEEVFGGGGGAWADFMS